MIYQFIENQKKIIPIRGLPDSKQGVNYSSCLISDDIPDQVILKVPGISDIAGSIGGC
jgi:hypothetical protein